MEINYEMLTPEQRQHFLDATHLSEEIAKNLPPERFRLLSRQCKISFYQEPHQEPVDFQKAMTSQRLPKEDLSDTLSPSEHDPFGKN